MEVTRPMTSLVSAGDESPAAQPIAHLATEMHDE